MTRKAIKIGLTGGIGSGKSFVASIFEVFNIPIYYADARSKKLLVSDKELKKQVKNLLGNRSYYRNGHPNKAFIAQKIFVNDTLLKEMNKIVHPRVKLDFENWSEQQESHYVIEESALIFEIKGQSHFNATILVVAEKETRIERVIKRDRTTRKNVLARMDKQLSDKQKRGMADFIIENNGNKSILQQVYKIHKKLLKIK